MKEEKNSPDEGEAVLIWSGNLSDDIFRDLEYWLKGVRRKSQAAGGATKRSSFGTNLRAMRCS